MLMLRIKLGIDVKNDPWSYCLEISVVNWIWGTFKKSSF